MIRLTISSRQVSHIPSTLYKLAAINTGSCGVCLFSGISLLGGTTPTHATATRTTVTAQRTHLGPLRSLRRIFSPYSCGTGAYPCTLPPRPPLRTLIHAPRHQTDVPVSRARKTGTVVGKGQAVNVATAETRPSATLLSPRTDVRGGCGGGGSDTSSEECVETLERRDMAEHGHTDARPGDASEGGA